MSNTSRNLGEYVKNIFDLNKDGRVTVGEFFSTLLPNNAIKIALLVVDALALLGEYRVWQVGMHVTGNDPYAAAGFVAVSLVPFYLGQVLWLYPLANGGQQAIAVVMVIVSLVTSMQFGFADLTQTYNVEVISTWVTRLWMFYIVMLLLYVLADKAFRLQRTKATAQANAGFQNDMNATMNSILQSLEGSLQREQELRARFGDDAVDAHLQLLRQAQGEKNNSRTRREDNAPPALPAPAANNQPKPNRAPGNQNQNVQYPHWEADALLGELGLTRQQAYPLLGADPNQFYNNLKPHGIEAVNISRKNFGKIYGQLRANGRVPANP